MRDLNLLEFYNFYSNTLEDRSYNASLLAFYEEIIKERIDHTRPLNILDMGVGFKSLFEDVDSTNFNVLAVDNVSIAILKAQEARTMENIRYELCDMAVDSYQSSQNQSRYDLILDSHMIHCVTDKGERENVFKNIYHSLKEDGIFCAEMMVESRENKKLKNKYVPKAIELEEEILNHGFKIKYFMIVPGLLFVDSENSCDLCRVICTK